MNCFETERLLVRHLTPDDLDDLAALCANPVAMQYMGDGETLSGNLRTVDRGVSEKYANRGYGTSGVFEKTSGAFIGICGVIRAPDNDFDEIIYAYQPAYWGQGYATEAANGMLGYVFGRSKLDAIYATIHPENTASQKMMAKIGMAFVEDRVEEDGTVTRVYVRRN